MDTPPRRQIWVNLAKARYYEANLDRDLLGDWTLRTAWGGLWSRRGGTYNTGVASYEDGIEQIDEIAKRRALRGYKPAEHPWNDRIDIPTFDAAQCGACSGQSSKKSSNRESAISSP